MQEGSICMQERESKMQNASAGAEKKGLFTKPTKRQAVLFARRVVAYVLGMFLIACGVSMSRSTNWGISPVNSIPNVLSLALPEISMGLWVIIVFACFILVQLAILGRQFKWYYIFQLVSSTLFGFLVDGTNALFGLFLPAEQAVWLKILLIAASTVVIACGIFLYLEGGLINMPGEGVTVALSKRTGLKVSTCKIIFDVSVVLIACILSLIFFRGSDVFWTLDGTEGMLRGVGIGTVVIAVFVGVVMKPITHFFKRPLHRFLYGEEPAAPASKGEPAKQGASAEQSPTEGKAPAAPQAEE